MPPGEYKCDKVIELECGLTKECYEPATLFYMSGGMQMASKRCPKHNIIGYKPEQGSLREMTWEEYEVWLVMDS